MKYWIEKIYDTQINVGSNYTTMFVVQQDTRAGLFNSFT